MQNAQNAVNNILKMPDYKEQRQQRKLRKQTVQTNSQKLLGVPNSGRAQNLSRSPRVEGLLGPMGEEHSRSNYNSANDGHEADMQDPERSDVFTRLAGVQGARKAGNSAHNLLKGLSGLNMQKQNS